MADVGRNVGPLKLAKLKPFSVLLLDNDITALGNEETCDKCQCEIFNPFRSIKFSYYYLL